MSKRTRHTSKEVENAIQAALEAGWTFEKPKGGHSHKYGTLKCPKNQKECRGGLFCSFQVRSTPGKPEGHAKKIMSAVNGCNFKENERENNANAEREDGTDV